MNIELIRSLAAERKIKWTSHGLERMQERDISRKDVLSCIASGKIIEDYPDDYPFPSCLIFSLADGEKPIHVVVGCDESQIYIITAYIPDLIKFESDLITRRK